MSKKISISLHNSHLFLKEEFTDNTSNVRISTHANAPLTELESLTLFTNRWFKRSFNDELLSNNGVRSVQQIKRVKTSLLGQNEVDHFSSFSKPSSKKNKNTGFVPDGFVTKTTEFNAKPRFTRELLHQNLTPVVHNTMVHQAESTWKKSLTLLGLAKQSGTPTIFLKEWSKRIRSGISRDFLLVTLNVILLTVFTVVQRSNYGKGALLQKCLTKNSVTTICKSKVPTIINSCEESTWQRLTMIKSGYLHRYFAFHLNDEIKQSTFLKKKCDLPFKTIGDAKLTVLHPKLSVLQIQPPETKPEVMQNRRFDTHTYKALQSERSSDKTFCCNKPELRSGVERTSFQKPEVFAGSEHSSSRTKSHFVFPDRNGAYLSFPNTKSSQLFIDVKKPSCIENRNFIGSFLPVQRSSSSSKIRANCLTGTEQRPVSISLKDTQNLCNDHKKSYTGKKLTLSRSQYYKPSFLSDQRLFLENDAIPAKRGTIRHQIGIPTLPETKSYNISNKRSTFTVPESVLKKCFYKYGFLLVWPSKKSLQSFAFKKIDTNCFAERNHIDNFLYNLSKPSFSTKAHFGIVDVQVAASLFPLSPLRQKRIKSLTDFSKVVTCRSIAQYKTEGFAKAKVLQSKLSVLHARRKASRTTARSLVSQIFDDTSVQNKFLNDPLFQLECSKALFLQNTILRAKAKLLQKQENTNNFHESFVCSPTCSTHTSYFLLRIPTLCAPSCQSNKMRARSSFVTKVGCVGELSSVDSLQKQSFCKFKNYAFESKATLLQSSDFACQNIIPLRFVAKLCNRSLASFQDLVQPSSGKEADSRSEDAHRNMGLTWSSNSTEFKKYEEYWQNQNRLTKNSFWHFIQEGLVFKTSVSGYQFPLFNKKEIIAFFFKKAVLNLSFKLSVLDKKIFFPLSSSLPQKGDKGLTFSLYLSKAKAKDIRQRLLEPRFNLETNQKKGLLTQITMPFCTLVDDIQMQYTQVDLNEIENIRNLFYKLGKDYENYLSKPKDSLPALIISPSLEDDREIEEEGIQIFSKRDFLKNQNTSTTPNPVHSDSLPISNKDTINAKRLPLTRNQDIEDTLDENVQNESFTDKFKVDNASFNNSSTMTSERMEKGVTIDFYKSKSETQKHQNRVKNALRQAQEEIDNIAKKEEKSTDKEKQGLSIPPLTRLEALYTIRNRERKVEQAKDLTAYKGVAKAENKLSQKLPIFEGLSLYDDEYQNSSLYKTNQSNYTYTPWLFSKLGDENVCTDRKHSFFGEISLRSKKVSAQEQKQILKQKKNPLFKTKYIESQFTDKSQANKKKSELVNFKVGDIGGSRNRIYFYDKLSQNKACQSSVPKTKNTPLLSPVSHRIWQAKRIEPSTFRVYPRTQSLPIVPTISQEDWNKMMEWQLKKYFFEEDKRLFSLLSENQGFAKSLKKHSTTLTKNTKLKIKKVHFYLPWIDCCKPTLDVLQNKCISMSCKPFNFAKQSSLHLSSPRKQPIHLFIKNYLIEWPLTRLDLMSPNHLSLFEQSRVLTSELSSHTAKFVKSNYKFNNYWQLPTQQNLFTLSGIPPKYTSHLEAPLEKAPLFTSSQYTRKVRTKSKVLLKKSAVISSEIVQTKPGSQSRVEAPIDKLNSNLNVYKPDSAFRVAISTDRATESIVFESVTKYSWLFIYTFFLALILNQLFKFIYKVGLKDFFIKFLNSSFGRTITSEEFRYSIQNPPLTECYTPKKRLEELFGLKSSKAQLLEIVWFLRNNCRGRNGPRGIVLVGPPGVENVSVVQAIAGEANVPIITQSLEKVALENEPQRQLEQLYKRAQKQAPCVLFLDQLDLIGARRDQLFIDNLAIDPEFIGSSTREKYSANKTVTSVNKLNVALRLLTILDGITKSTGVITVATTQDLAKLDPALLRPKRFDRRIYLSLPNQDDRIQLLKKQTQSIGHSQKMPWNYLSLRAESMSLINIRAAINYSLFKAVLQNSVHTVETLEYGIDCVKSLIEPSIIKNTSSKNTFKNTKMLCTTLNKTEFYKSFCKHFIQN